MYLIGVRVVVENFLVEKSFGVIVLIIVIVVGKCFVLIGI